MPLLQTIVKGKAFVFLGGNPFGTFEGSLIGDNLELQMKNAVLTVIRNKKDISDKEKDSLEDRLSLPFSGFSATLYYKSERDPDYFVSDSDGFHLKEERP